MGAVKQEGIAIRYASTLFWKDREVILEAVKQDNFAVQAVQNACDETKTNRKNVMEAIKQAKTCSLL